jgi:hypothetical protein
VYAPSSRGGPAPLIRKTLRSKICVSVCLSVRLSHLFCNWHCPMPTFQIFPCTPDPSTAAHMLPNGFRQHRMITSHASATSKGSGKRGKGENGDARILGRLSRWRDGAFSTLLRCLISKNEWWRLNNSAKSAEKKCSSEFWPFWGKNGNIMVKF